MAQVQSATVQSRRLSRLSFILQLLVVPGLSWVTVAPPGGIGPSGGGGTLSSSAVLTHPSSDSICGHGACRSESSFRRRRRVSRVLLMSKKGRERIVDAGGRRVDEPEREPRYKAKNMPRDEGGLPVERVYAPRMSKYGVPKMGGGGGPRKLREQGRQRDPGIANPAKLRVLGGLVRGRRLESPDVYMRPMMGKVKEALFSTLTAFELFDTGSVRVMDCFGGSGSVGCEALSRGAQHVTFVDFSKDCCEVAVRNVERCGFEKEQGQAVCADVLEVLRDPVKYGLDVTVPYDLVTLTPPYTEIVYADLIKAVAESPAVGENTIVVIEYPVELGCLPHVIEIGRLVGLRNRRYGRTVLAIYIVRPSGKYEFADSRPEEFISLK